MAGRFPLYTDADIHGPFVNGLIRAGWDVLRAIDACREGEDDIVHFKRAAREGRVLVTNDRDQVKMAVEWILAGRAFPGLITWKKRSEQGVSVGHFVRLFNELAQRENPFSPYPIVYLKFGSLE